MMDLDDHGGRERGSGARVVPRCRLMPLLLEVHQPRRRRFYQKLSDRAFNQVMLHEISECEWDDKTRSVTSPTSRSELSVVIEFENQDWVKNLAKADNSTPKKNFVDPNVAFPF